MNHLEVVMDLQPNNPLLQYQGDFSNEIYMNQINRIYQMLLLGEHIALLLLYKTLEAAGRY